MRLLAAAAVIVVASTALSVCAEEPAPPAPAPNPSSSSAARKPCEDLKSEIAAKLDAKGVKNYTLEIVATDKTADLKEGKIVGSCDGGTNKIVYTRAQ